MALASSLLRSLVTSTKHQPNDFRVRRGTRGQRQLERFCGFPVSTNVGAGLPFFTIASRGRRNPFPMSTNVGAGLPFFTIACYEHETSTKCFQVASARRWRWPRGSLKGDRFFLVFVPVDRTIHEPSANSTVLRVVRVGSALALASSFSERRWFISRVRACRSYHPRAQRELDCSTGCACQLGAGAGLVLFTID